MNFQAVADTGIIHVRLKRFSDMRGSFVKTVALHAYLEAGISFSLKEEFYSVSNARVIRGMHFQLPPDDHAKIVYCATGAVEDVLLDLRKGPGYGKTYSFTLSGDEPSLLVIPRGIAHGFKTLQDNSLMVYKTDTEHSVANDKGICWDSFGYNWNIQDPILSDRDKQHVSFKDFVSPF